MKKSIALSLMLLAATASIASAAAGLNLSWTSCGVTGASNKTFACNSNTGTNLMAASYTAPSGTTAISGNEVVIDLAAAAATLPDWWKFKNAGSCRLSSLSANQGPTVGCNDYWAGQATPAIAGYQIGLFGANSARIKGIVATGVAFQGPLTAGDEYLSMNVVINNTKTVGSPSCTGCATAVCIVLNEIKVTQPVGLGDYRIQNPADRNYVNWQSAGGPSCPGATPTQTKTWGSVKALYR